MKKYVWLIVFGLIVVGCSGNEEQKSELEKGFQVNEISEDSTGKKEIGVQIDTLNLESRPNNVLSTYHAEHRLTPVYLVNYGRKTKKPYIGSNNYIWNWYHEELEGNNWNSYMPGMEAVQGYNMINVSHYNNETNTENKLFEKPALIRTLYYPAFSKDTLNFKPIIRDYYMVSVYDEDTNKDGYINFMDLRRFYYFDLDGNNKKLLIPKDYAVISSQYDWANDYMYVYARQDENNNGKMESAEPTSIFWIDLKNPENNGLHYSPSYD